MGDSHKNNIIKQKKIRPNYILEALKWLITNNNEWQQIAIDLEKIRENLKNPTLIDNANIEYNAENNNTLNRQRLLKHFFLTEL